MQIKRNINLFIFFVLTSSLQAEVNFQKQVQPLFVEFCLKCHGADKQEASLRLDLKEAAFTGGDSGEVIIPGNPDESLLFKLVSGKDPDRPMPPDNDLLNQEQVDLIKSWITEGANWAEE